MKYQVLIVFILLSIGMTTSRSLQRVERDTSQALPYHMMQLASEHKQGGGVFAMGTLVAPLLLMMGMGSFMSLLPQMFHSAMSGVGPNLFQLLRPNVAANSGGSRLKRSVRTNPLISEDLLEEIERRLTLALSKNEVLEK